MKRQEILFGLKSFSFIYDHFLLFPAASMGAEKSLFSDYAWCPRASSWNAD
jgi:hypothetical protein